MCIFPGKSKILRAILLLVPLLVRAQECKLLNGTFSFSVSPLTGFLYGSAEEIVYGGTGSDDKESQLVWEMKPLVYAGAGLTLDWARPESGWGLFTESSVTIGFPMKTGLMEDKDWLKTDNNGTWLPDVLTHYSVSACLTDSALMIKTRAGAAFSLFERCLFQAFLEYHYKSFSWTAKGGSYLYAQSGGGYYSRDDEIGTYTQTWHILSPGLSFYVRFERFFEAGIALSVSPFLWCDTLDEHLLRNFTVKNTLSLGFFIEPELTLSWMPNDFFTLSMAVSYTYAGTRKGASNYKREGQPAKTSWDRGGADFSAFDIGLRAKFNVFPCFENMRVVQ